MGSLIELDIVPGKSAWQKERLMKTSDVEKIRPIIEALVRAGIF